MMQPMATSGAVENPNSSAPSKRGDHDIAAGLQFAIHLHADAAAQIVHDQHLLRFGEAEFPGNAGVLDGGERRSAGAAVVTADEHHVGVRLRNTGGNRTDADFGHQLHRNARSRIDVLQVVDQLRQVFDRINVVMRRRRNEADTRNRVAHARDGLVHFMAGQLAAFAGLGALRDFDLQFVGIDQVIGR